MKQITDKNMKRLVRNVQHACEDWFKAVTITGNQCAWTDRYLEDIIEKAQILKEKYKKQFEE